MKKLIILSFLFVGCGESDTQRFDRFLTELDCPVILIGKTDKASDHPSVVVRDGKGRVRTLGATYADYESNNLPAAISNSRNVGDTLKPCK